MKRMEFWFLIGSQSLYGPSVLEIVETRAREMAEQLSKVLPYPLVYKVTAKTNKEITEAIKEANYDDSCAGIVTWCHTFRLARCGSMVCKLAETILSSRYPVPQGNTKRYRHGFHELESGRAWRS